MAVWIHGTDAGLGLQLSALSTRTRRKGSSGDAPPPRSMKPCRGHTETRAGPFDARYCCVSKLWADQPRNPSMAGPFAGWSPCRSRLETHEMKPDTPIKLVRSDELTNTVPYAYAAVTPPGARLVFTAGA